MRKIKKGDGIIQNFIEELKDELDEISNENLMINVKRERKN